MPVAVVIFVQDLVQCEFLSHLFTVSLELNELRVLMNKGGTAKVRLTVDPCERHRKIN